MVQGAEPPAPPAPLDDDAPAKPPVDEELDDEELDDEVAITEPPPRDESPVVWVPRVVSVQVVAAMSKNKGPAMGDEWRMNGRLRFVSHRGQGTLCAVHVFVMIRR